MHVISSNVLLLMIKSKCNTWKNFVAFANFFLYQTMYFENFACITLHDFWCFFLSYFHFINFFEMINYFWTTMIQSKMLILRRCFRSHLLMRLYRIDKFFDKAIFQKKQFMTFFYITYYCFECFIHQCFFIHISHVFLLFETSHEHENHINR
jgi:hypothetical protein